MSSGNGPFTVTPAEENISRTSVSAELGMAAMVGEERARAKSGDVVEKTNFRGHHAPPQGHTAQMVPAVRAALLCERVLHEVDGVKSAIRIFNQLEAAPGTVVEATLLLMLVTVEGAAAPERRTLHMRIDAPSRTLGEQQIALTVPPEPGAAFNLVMPLRVEAGEPGTCWLRFHWEPEGQPIAHIPIHFRAPAATSGKADADGPA